MAPKWYANGGLDEWQGEILRCWNYINLYSLTRGINRFKGLLMALREIDRDFVKIEDLESLAAWVGTTKELSNNALSAAIERSPESISLKKGTCLEQCGKHGYKKAARGRGRAFQNG